MICPGQIHSVDCVVTAAAIDTTTRTAADLMDKKILLSI